MKTLFVSFYPQDLRPRQCFDGMNLFPGVNHLNAEQWQKLSKHPTSQFQLESGELKVIEPIATKPKGNLSDYSEADAIAIVKGRYESAELIEWLEDEKRSPVIEALKIQIRLLEAIGCPPKFSTDNGNMNLLAWLDSLRPNVVYKHYPQFNPIWRTINKPLSTATV
jgi:hypothetical protein